MAPLNVSANCPSAAPLHEVVVGMSDAETEGPGAIVAVAVALQVAPELTVTV